MNSRVSLPLMWGLLGIAQMPMLFLYLWLMRSDPIYGWLPWALVVTTLLLVGLRWDRKCEPPASYFSLGLLVSGMLVALAGAALRYDWLAALGWLCSTGSFLSAHHERDGRSLLPIWYLSWGMICWPLGLGDMLTQNLTRQLSAAVQSILRLLQFPHIGLPNAIEVVDGKVFMDQSTYSWFSWPLFVALAMLHSAVARRTPAVALLNYLSALFACFAYHCLVHSAAIYSHIVDNSWQSWLWRSLVAAVIYGMFVSMERGFRTLLQPISENTSSSRMLNPFEFAWNWCFTESRPVEVPIASVRQWPVGKISLGLFTLALATLVVQFIRVPTAIAACWNQPGFRLDAEAIRKQVFRESQVVDYRHTYFDVPMLTGNEADVWTVQAPLSTTKHFMLCQAHAPRSAAIGLVQQGWSVRTAKTVTVKLPGGTPLTYEDLQLTRAGREIQVFATWLAPNATPLQLPNTSAAEVQENAAMSNSDANWNDLQAGNETQRGYWIVSSAPLIKSYRGATVKVLLAEFSRVIVAVRTQLLAASQS